MMKNIYAFRLSIFILAFFCILLNTQTLRAQTTLGAGDIAITLMNMEGSDTDAFGFVLLKAVEAGTVIQVTDKEYTTGIGFEANEGILTMSFNSAFPCGTEVIVTDIDPAAAVYDFQANLAGITAIASPANSFQLATSGETLIFFQSDNLTNPPGGSFISALANTGVAFGMAASGSSDLPPGLTIGSSAMVMTSDSNGNEWDNIKYNCSTTANSDLNALRTAIYTPANWLTDNDSPLPTTSCDPTFSCMDACTDPTVTFNVSASEFCIDAGLQTGLGGGTPAGGSYSGTGITDDSNGMTFSFDPIVAGIGMHILRYNYTAPDGCSNFAEATVEVLDLPVVSIAGPPFSTCINVGITTGLGGGTPMGGVYSGTGVTTNGIGFDFDANVAGVGVHTLTYSYTAPNGCSNSVDAILEVLAAPVATFSTPDSVSINATVQMNLSNGFPTGGVYSGAGVTDNGNGFGYSFDPAAAGVGIHTITYTVVNADGCMSSSSDDIKVFQLLVSAIDDIDETDANGIVVKEGDLVAVQGIVHCGDFSEGDPIEFWIMEAGGSGISVFSSNGVNSYVVTEGDELYIEGDLSTFNGLLDILPSYIEVKSQENMLNTPIEVMELGEEEESKWVTLTEATVNFGEILVAENDGYRFSIVSNGGNPIDIVVKDVTGIDSMFLAEFIQSSGESAGVNITGIVSQSDNSIPFNEGYELWPCNEDAFELIVGTNEPSWAADLQLYPNPTSDILQFNAPVEIEMYRLIDLQGRILQSGAVNNTQHRLSLQHLPNGVYQLQLINDGSLVTRRVIRQ